MKKNKYLFIVIATYMVSCGSITPCECVNNAKSIAVKIQNTTKIIEQTKLASEAIALEQKCSELAEKDANSWEELIMNCN